MCRSIMQRGRTSGKRGFSLIPWLNSSVRWKSLADELCAAYGGWTIRWTKNAPRHVKLEGERGGHEGVKRSRRRGDRGAQALFFAYAQTCVYRTEPKSKSAACASCCIPLRLYHVATGWSARETGPKEPSPRACPAWCRASYVATNQLHLAENHLSPGSKGERCWTWLDPGGYCALGGIWYCLWREKKILQKLKSNI